MWLLVLISNGQVLKDETLHRNVTQCFVCEGYQGRILLSIFEIDEFFGMTSLLTQTSGFHLKVSSWFWFGCFWWMYSTSLRSRNWDFLPACLSPESWFVLQEKSRSISNPGGSSRPSIYDHGEISFSCISTIWTHIIKHQTSKMSGIQMVILWITVYRSSKFVPNPWTGRIIRSWSFQEVGSSDVAVMHVNRMWIKICFSQVLQIPNTKFQICSNIDTTKWC